MEHSATRPPSELAMRACDVAEGLFAVSPIRTVALSTFGIDDIRCQATTVCDAPLTMSRKRRFEILFLEISIPKNFLFDNRARPCYVTTRLKPTRLRVVPLFHRHRGGPF